MKKYVQAALILFFIMSVLSACREYPEEQLESAEAEAAPAESDGISIETTKEEYVPGESEITYVLYNDSDQDFTYGKHFTLEKEENGTWQSVPFKDGAAFIEIVLIIPPGESASETIPLHLFDRPLSEGTYRIVKQIGESSLAAEFQIVE